MLRMKAQACQAAAMAILTNGPYITPGPWKYGNWIKKRKRMCGSSAKLPAAALRSKAPQYSSYFTQVELAEIRMSMAELERDQLNLQTLRKRR